MTTPTPIIAPNTTGVLSGQKSPAAQASAPAGGLMGFLTVLLQNNGMAGAQNAATGTQGAAETATSLAAKITGLLNSNAGAVDAATLEQFLPAGLAKLVADQLSGLQAFARLAQPQTTPPPTAAISQPAPTLLGEGTASDSTKALTSDLTSAGATTAQDAELMNALAQQLNAIDVGGAGADETTAATAHPTAATPSVAGAPAAPDSTATDTGETTNLLSTLLALGGETVDGDAPAAPLALRTADTAAQAPRASTPLAETTPFSVFKGTAAGASSDEPLAGDARGLLSASADPAQETAKAAAPKNMPAVNTPAASLAAQLAQGHAPQQPAAQQPAGGFNGMLGSTLGTLNALLSGGMDGGGFDQGFGQGFGGQQGLPADGSATDAALRLSPATGSFTTYMNAAAKAANPATTQMIGVQISRNASAKVDTFTMTLDPVDLGKLEVRMSFAKDGKMSARLIADKPETLSMLQRDSAQLERILQQSGLDVADNALSFDLREGNQQSLYDGAGDRNNDSIYAGRGDHAHKNNGDITAQLAIEAAGYISQTGVNIMV